MGQLPPPMEILHGIDNSNPLDDMIRPYLPPTLPKDLSEIHEEVRRNIAACAEARLRSSTAKDKLEIGDLVLLRECPISDAAQKIIYKFCPLYSGPYLVSACPYPNVYTICDPLTEVKKGNYNITNLKYIMLLLNKF
uniref:Uncharacterized protein n=1 Tax=Photinus pyralis TaxID=7054 RepID=A0A1Y1ND07_PHOPY